VNLTVLLAQTPPPTTPTSPTPTPTGPTGIMLPSVLWTSIIWVTFIAFFVIVFLPERTPEQRTRIRSVALFASGVSFFLATFYALLGQIALAEGGGVATAHEESYTWLHSFSFTSNYHLTADGISLVLLVLSTVVFGCAVFHSWKVNERVRLYCGLLMLLETSVNGVFCSADLVLFLIFWGMQIVPLFLLLRVFSGPGGERTSQRYLAFALTSYALLIASLLLLIVRANQHTSDLSIDLVTLQGAADTAGFWLSFAAFAIAIGAFPVHRWMVETHSNAGAGVAAVASGVVLKLGGYGLLRITLEAFPHTSKQMSLVIVGLAVVSALWGALGALAQDDLRRLLAYGNIVQMALVLLAVGTRSSLALEGAVFVMVAHGFASAILILVTGAVEERTRTRSIRALGGLADRLPRLSGFALFAVLSAVGAPLLAGFVAELFLFTGAFPEHRIATVLVMASLIVYTGGLVWALHRVFFGALKPSFERARDASTLELTYLIPLVVGILFFGIRPGSLTPVITNGVQAIVTRLTGG
jgi:NADH-quinone oxidoreductase subunit M